MDRNTKLALLLSAAVLGIWAFTNGNETLAESEVKQKPLLRAAYAGDVGEVRRLLSEGAPVEERDGQGWSALHHATSLEAHQHNPEGNHVAVAQALLKGGANPSAKAGSYGEAPLYRAVYDPDLVEVLLKAGADPNYGLLRRTPLISASYLGGPLCRAGTESVRLLLKAGADVQAEERGGFTALTTAAVYGCPGMVRVLLDAGAKVDGKMGNGQTVIEWVKTTHEMQQGTMFGAEWKQVHEDNLKLLYEAASNQAARRQTSGF